MTVSHMRGPVSPIRMIPREIVTMAAFAVAIFAVVATGGFLASILPAAISSPWLTLACYAAPGAVAFAIYWWVAQRQ